MNHKIGIIGYGNMASAIVRALSERSSEFSISVFDTDVSKTENIAFKGVDVCRNASVLVRKSDIVMLCVKPQVADSALSGLDFGGKTVVSIMAGITISRLAALVGRSTDKIVRVMPNMNAKIGRSVNAYCCQNLTDREASVIESILSSFGHCYMAEERMMNAVTGISGSGPAFVFEFVNAFIQTAIKNGFDEKTAKEIACDTISASVENMRGCDSDAETLIKAVCSKGGTTIEGINFLRENHFSETVEGAIERAVRRSEEMEKDL